MKKIATTLLLAFVCFSVNAQYLVITKDGVKAKEGSTSYATVKFPQMSKEELKNAIANAVGSRWYYPEKVMNITDSWIVVNTNDYISSGKGKDYMLGAYRFYIENGKVDFHFDLKEINKHNGGGRDYQYGIVKDRFHRNGLFSKSGKLRREDLKNAAEDEINSEIEWFINEIRNANTN